MAAEALEKYEGTRLSPLWKCVSWRGMRNGRAVVLLSASRSQHVRAKGNEMRGRGGGGTGGGGPHLVKAHFRSVVECALRYNTRQEKPKEGESRQSCTASPSLDMCPG